MRRLAALVLVLVLTGCAHAAQQQCQREYGHRPGQASHYETICR
jgi:hypothetical protein